MWSNYANDEGLLQVDEFGNFLEEYWGFNPGKEWSTKYWNAVDAYCREYKGIKPEDFVECWINFDERGMDFFKEPEIGLAKDFCYDENPEMPHKSEEYQGLCDSIVSDIFGHWSR